MNDDGWKITFLLGWPIFRGYAAMLSFQGLYPWICDCWMPGKSDLPNGGESKMVMNPMV